MTHKNFTKGIIAVMVALLAGCGKEPPKCSDDATLLPAKKAILEQILKTEQNNLLANILITVTQGGLSSAMKNGLSEQEILDNMKFDAPRATAFDAKVKKYSCDAQLTVGNSVKLSVNYDSQLDDKLQHLVFVNPIVEADLFAIDAELMETITKNKEAASTAVPAQPPQVQTLP